MTSSLVGSEMCIRDSLRSTRLATATHGHTPTHTPHAQFAQAQHTYQQPVSYTHLTLPTICSV
eukprot:3304880-Prorocentrum_lima.AAC.1